jgi:hypothetical protein
MQLVGSERPQAVSGWCDRADIFEELVTQSWSTAFFADAA